MFDPGMTVLVDRGVIFGFVGFNAFNVFADVASHVLQFFGIASRVIRIGHQNCKRMIVKVETKKVCDIEVQLGYAYVER